MPRAGLEKLYTELIDTYLVRLARDMDDALARAEAVCQRGLKRWPKNLELLHRLASVKVAQTAGFHPSSVSKFNEKDYDEIKALLNKDKVVAVGEIGLDYYYDTNPRDMQMDIFTQQLQTARDLNMPSIMHIRDAWGDFLPMLKGWNQEAVVHCWTGSLESAKICLDAGLHISFTGSVTFKNANKLRAVAKYIPMNRLMIETDAPYMAPVPKRGKRNEPKYVLHIAEMFAEIKGLSLETVAEKTFENGKRFFNINGV